MPMDTLARWSKGVLRKATRDLNHGHRPDDRLGVAASVSLALSRRTALILTVNPDFG